MISIIVAKSNNNVIGRNGNTPWHISSDLKWFKSITMDRTVVMGRKTYNSIGNPLMYRDNIVLTYNKDLKIPGCKVYNDFKTIIEDNANKDIIVIGGESIYKLALPYTNTLYITEIDAIINGDTYFPKLNMDEWICVLRSKHISQKEGDYHYTFKIYKRKNTV